jgi:uncharacterized protein (DUF58 family)
MLTREVLQRVREIQIRTRRQVADVLAGEYVSAFRGRGIEFDEVRPYVAGDDVRTIDWKVTARMGEPYVKRYVEERQLTLMLVADVSASQDFGSRARSKREAAAEFCALLAFSAIRNSDKVGLTLFHGAIEQYIPPRKGQKHALRVIREVLAHGALSGAAAPAAQGPKASRVRSLGAALRRARPVQLRHWLRAALPGARPRAPRQATDIARALEFLLSVTARKTICFVVSDFRDAGFERALRAANRKHDVVAVLVTDAAEIMLPDVGLVALRDAETGRVGLYDTGAPAFRAEVERIEVERVHQLERQMRASGIDFIHIDATASVVEPLVEFFRARERRRRG